MPFIKSRIAIALVISAVSLGAAYAALQTFSDNSPESPASILLADLNDGFATRWKARTGVDISVRQAQNKSGAPIRAVTMVWVSQPLRCIMIGTSCAKRIVLLLRSGIPLHLNMRSKLRGPGPLLHRQSYSWCAGEIRRRFLTGTIFCARAWAW
jgi:hypothetical protein